MVEVESGNDAILCRRFDRKKVAPYARHNEDSDPRKMLFPVIASDEALKYPFGRVVQQGSSGSENLARRSEEDIVEQTMLEIGDNEVVEVMTRCSAVHKDSDAVVACTGLVLERPVPMPTGPCRTVVLLRRRPPHAYRRSLAHPADQAELLASCAPRTAKGGSLLVSQTVRCRSSAWAPLLALSCSVAVNAEPAVAKKSTLYRS